MIAILDYGSGNLRSAQRAFELTGHKVVITSDASTFLSADAFVVPGVGAFGACMNQLKAIDGPRIVRAAIATDKPFFGICVGMQILFSQGEEKGMHSGLDVFEGEVCALKAPVLPHIGWNTIETESQIFEGVSTQMFYFVHTYAAKKAPKDSQVTWTNYGEKFISAIEHKNVFATQFHPEKSGEAGARLIENWATRI